LTFEHQPKFAGEVMSYPYVTDILNALFGTQWRLPIPVFGFIVVVAILMATFVARREVQRLGRDRKLPDTAHLIVSDLAMVTGLAGLVGARFFDVLDNLSQFVAAPAAMVFSRSGFSIYGGLLFGVLAGIVFLKRHSIPIRPMLDAVAPAMMIGYAIGRQACQVVGDGDWGVASDMALKPGWLPAWFWAQTYDGNILGVAIESPGVYPTPIYESMAAFALFGVLWAFRRHPHHAGFLFSLYLLFAGFERLLIEKIRINAEHAILGLSLTQAEAVSVVVIAAGLIGALMTLQTRRRWTRIAFSLAVLSALSACVPF